MSASVQALLVFAIVVAASAYAALRFMPAAWRRVVASRTASLVSRAGVSEANARRVEAKLSTGGACGSCDSCNACAGPEKTKGDEPTFVAASAYPPSIPIRRVS